MMIQDQEDYHPPWPQIDQDKLDLVLDFFAIFLSVVNFQWGDREGWNQEWRESVALTFRSVSLWSWRLSSDPTTDCGFGVGVGGGYGDGGDVDGDENMQPWDSGVSHSHHDDSLLILHRTQDWTKRCTVQCSSAVILAWLLENRILLHLRHPKKIHFNAISCYVWVA